MRYFSNIADVTELKKAYKKLALELHPDKGGKTADFQEMSNQYQDLLKALLSGKMSAQDLKDELDIDEQMREALNKVINLAVLIEIVGNWIWITGNTFPVKDDIKNAGFKFAGKKKAWYWNDGKYTKKSKKSFSLDEIREQHGAQTVQNKYTKTLN